MIEPIILDASKFESNGTLIRCALAFSSITSKPFVVEKFLLEEKFPGLSAQNVALIDAFASATSADVAGNGVGSSVIQFFPKLPFNGKHIEIDFSSSANVVLPLHSFLIPALLSKDKISIKLTGGTHVSDTPTPYFLKETVLSYLSPYFENLSLQVPIVGFYPKAEGSLVFNSRSNISKGDKNRPLNIAPNKTLVALKGELISSGERLDSDVLKNINSMVALSLKHFKVPLIIQPQYVASKSSGASMTLVALFGTAEGYDNSFPYTIGLDRTWSSLSSIDKQSLEDSCLAFISDFNNLLSKQTINLFSAELILPFIAILGGSILVSEITDTMRLIISLSKEFLDVEFIIEGNLLKTKGYLSILVDSLPSIEDL